MTDNVTDTNLSQVVSSYGDVNTALEKLLANMPSQSNTISSTLGMGSSDLAGGGLFFQSSTGEPVFSYKDKNGNTQTIPLESVSAANTSISNAINNASNASLPTAISGGSIPQVLGVSGRTVIQSFLCTNANNQVITFPSPFATGTTPLVLISPQDPGSPAVASIITNSITNTSFRIGSFWAGGSAGFNWIAMGDTIHPITVLAIGVM